VDTGQPFEILYQQGNRRKRWLRQLVTQKRKKKTQHRWKFRRKERSDAQGQDLRRKEGSAHAQCRRFKRPERLIKAIGDGGT